MSGQLSDITVSRPSPDSLTVDFTGWYLAEWLAGEGPDNGDNVEPQQIVHHLQHEFLKSCLWLLLELSVGEPSPSSPSWASRRLILPGVRQAGGEASDNGGEQETTLNTYLTTLSINSAVEGVSAGYG